MFCRNCGNEIDSDALFCPSCGVKLTDDLPNKYCFNCGSKLEDDDIFCMKCGANTSEEKTQDEIKKNKLLNTFVIVFFAILILVSIICNLLNIY